MNRMCQISFFVSSQEKLVLSGSYSFTCYFVVYHSTSEYCSLVQISIILRQWGCCVTKLCFLAWVSTPTQLEASAEAEQKPSTWARIENNVIHQEAKSYYIPEARTSSTNLETLSSCRIVYLKYLILDKQQKQAWDLDYFAWIRQWNSRKKV